jgi:hypothetical protein
MAGIVKVLEEKVGLIKWTVIVHGDSIGRKTGRIKLLFHLSGQIYPDSVIVEAIRRGDLLMLYPIAFAVRQIPSGELRGRFSPQEILRVLEIVFQGG